MHKVSQDLNALIPNDLVRPLRLGTKMDSLIRLIQYLETGECCKGDLGFYHYEVEAHTAVSIASYLIQWAHNGSPEFDEPWLIEGGFETAELEKLISFLHLSRGFTAVCEISVFLQEMKPWLKSHDPILG